MIVREILNTAGMLLIIKKNFFPLLQWWYKLHKGNLKNVFCFFCELSPVLRLSLETDTLPVSAVALPLSFVVLPYATDQLRSHHHTVTLLQDGREWHHLCCWKICPRFIGSNGSCWSDVRSGDVSVMRLFVQGKSDASASSRLLASTVSSLCGGLGSVHDFYRCTVAISDPCCHSTISVHWHPRPSDPCLIPR